MPKKKEKLYKTVARYFSKDPDQISDQTDIITDLNAEEIELDEITLLIEDEFEIFVPTRFTKVGEFADYIESSNPKKKS